MTVFKVFFYALVALGWLFIFAVLIGKFIAAGSRRPEPTVLWWKTDSVMNAYTGRLTHLDERHIVVEGVEGPVVIAKADVIEVL